MLRKYKFAKYQIAKWMLAAVEHLRPRERLPVSVWAEQNRVLSGLSSAVPGPWNNSITPYLVDIMDAFSDDTTEMIVFVKPAQVGGTTAMENMLGWVMDHEPSPTLMVYPSDELAEATVDARLLPMIEKTPVLAAKYRASDSKKRELKFADMRLYLTGANSPADLSSKSVRNLFLDEVDKFPGASRREADPVSLALERTKAFHNRKIVPMSTPTLKDGHIWRLKEAADVEKHYFVPCPHCGEMIELKFAQIKWPGKDKYPTPAERAARAVYICQKCGGVITDRDKGKMLAAGRWKIVRQHGGQPKRVAFWINTLYSPFTTFCDIAAEFMRSKDDTELLHNFVNSWLAEPWEDTKVTTNADLLLERQTEVEAYFLPEWTRLLTAGIDVQENSVYWTIRAWGNFMTSQNVAHGQTLSLQGVAEVMNTEFYMPDGSRMLVHLALIDSGDQTELVYDFCAENSDWVLPCKGTGNMASHFRISVINKADSKANGMQLVLVDGAKYKELIAARMRKENGKGSWMVHKDCDREYAEQVTAEHKITERSGGRVVTMWVPKTTHADNHYLDCEVYAAAAADVLNVRSLFLQEEKKEPEQPAQKAEIAKPEEDWIKANERW